MPGRQQDAVMNTGVYANSPAVRLALVGDRSPTVRAHGRIPRLLRALAERDGLPTDTYWVHSADVADGAELAAFDAVWVVPGSPYASEAGVLTAIRAAREGGVPFLGTCGGFQHALLEFARNVCGWTTAGHRENDPEAADALIVPLACSLAGHEEEVRYVPGTLAERVWGAERSVERYHCSYGPAPDRLAALAARGLVFGGTDAAGVPRVLELPGHPFFLATLFQPELAGDGDRPHPAVRALARAAAARAAARADATA
jgi:CTP synthase (UTP-ammonia lyase)